jgi:tyrosine-protein kinase Etk/Wzc
MKGEAVIPLNDEIDIRAMLDLLMKNVKPIALWMIVFVLGGMLYLVAATPIYRANITVQVEDNSDLTSAAVGSVIGGLSSLFDIKSTDAGEIEILRSRLVANKAVNSLALYIEAQPKRFPLIGAWIARHNQGGVSKPGIFGMGGYAWGNEQIAVSQFDVPRDWENDLFTVTALGGGGYRLSGDDLKSDVVGRVGTPLDVDEGQGPVRLLVTGLNGPAGVVFQLRRHARLVVLESLRQQLNISELGKDQSGMIGVTYDDSDPVRASEILNDIADSYVAQNLSRKVETADKSLKFLQGQLPDVRHQLEEAEDRLTAYQNRRKVVDLGEQAKGILTQSADAQTTLFQLQQKRKELLATLSERHPLVVSVDKQIAAAQQTLGDFELELRGLPNDQQGIVRLTRDVRVETEIYLGLLGSVQQLRLARAGGVGNVRVIDRAIVSEAPVRPRSIIILSLSLVIGLFVGVVASFLRIALSGRITDPVDIERQTLMEVIAAIPVSEAQHQLTRLARQGIEGGAVLSIRTPRDTAVEALRTLRTAVQFALPEHGKRVVLVTGPSEGVGKSFTASNLSVLLGVADKRVLLIDADLRRGRLRQEFGVTARLGLSDVLRGNETVESAITQGVAPNVDLLSAGSLDGHPDELFEKANVKELIETLASRYDVIVIDSPPVLPVTDTAILASIADVVLLVAKSGMTTGGEILETVKRLQRAGSDVKYVVFNSFKPGLRSQQYRYYRGYYQQPATPAPLSEPRRRDSGERE